jgi:hypothetical protein
MIPPPPVNSYEQQTVVVDRATLFPQSTRLVVDEDALKQLDELLKANLDVDVPRARKRKRRKLSSPAKGQSTLHEATEPARKSDPIYLYCDCVNWKHAQAFRLLSTANDPKVISLEPKPLPVRA